MGFGIPEGSNFNTAKNFDNWTNSTENYNKALNGEETEEFEWLQEHAHEYGFILRYPKGKEFITGYNYEPWHFRYVGDIAIFIDSTLEEYYFSNYELPVFN